MTVIEELKIFSKKEHYSQNEIAKGIGVTPATVSCWFNGKKGMSPSNTRKVEDFLYRERLKKQMRREKATQEIEKEALSSFKAEQSEAI